MKHLHEALDSLITKYSTNPYMSNRLETYILQILPAALDNACVNHDKREERKVTLTQNRKSFIEKFMNKNKNYYCPANKLFLQYDGIHFVGHGEDDIQHNILSTITKEGSLTAWKYKINNEVIRTIKSRSPLDAIPESFTIQHTINMLIPFFFNSKYGAKYFLTILGDNILGTGNKNNVYIISASAKEIVQEIGHLWSIYFTPNNIVQNIKYKYYGHDYQHCRLLNINTEYISAYKNLASNISKYIIDLLCVATHYSRRYGSADKYLENCPDTEFVDHVLYLTKKTSNEIVDTFISTCVDNCQGSKMETKNLIFIWKKFLKEKKFPNIIFYEPLKVLFKEKLQYQEKDDVFLNITSTSLPLVASFIDFWESTYQADENENEIEIDELCFLFKKWANKSFPNLTETFLLELIRHYYPNVEIESNKYLLNTRNKLWDKRGDVVKHLELYKLHANDIQQISTLSTAYEFYIKKQNFEFYNYKVSKRYFEKIAIEELGDSLDIDGVIN